MFAIFFARFSNLLHFSHFFFLSAKLGIPRPTTYRIPEKIKRALDKTTFESSIPTVNESTIRGEVRESPSKPTTENIAYVPCYGAHCPIVAYPEHNAMPLPRSQSLNPSAGSQVKPYPGQLHISEKKKKTPSVNPILNYLLTLKALTWVEARLYAGESVLLVNREVGKDLNIFPFR